MTPAYFDMEIFAAKRRRHKRCIPRDGRLNDRTEAGRDCHLRELEIHRRRSKKYDRRSVFFAIRRYTGHIEKTYLSRQFIGTVTALPLLTTHCAHGQDNSVMKLAYLHARYLSIWYRLLIDCRLVFQLIHLLERGNATAIANRICDSSSCSFLSIPRVEYRPHRLGTRGFLERNGGREISADWSTYHIDIPSIAWV